MIEEICERTQCTGCMACVNICNHDAIKIFIDEEGFERPRIDNDLCIECRLCQKTCPINTHPTVNEAKKVFSGWSKKEEVRLRSSSGGAFTEIAKLVLDRGGFVFGCALNENLQAEHVYVDKLEDLYKRLCGSKYVQSHIGKTYQQVKNLLQQEKLVLFSGTPCQIAGLKNYLRKDYKNLITVDLICHGVPSPKVFEDYKKYMQEHENMELTDIKFRCKKSSWIFFNMTLTGHVEKNSSNKTYIGNYYDDPYIRGFLRDYFLRPSCHQCHFTSIKRCSDFTIADWWGYKKETPSDKDFAYKGVSLLMVNTDRALSLLSKIDMEIKERSIADAMRTNICLSHPFPIKEDRKCFWNDYSKMSFGQIIEKYMMPEPVSWQVNIRQHYRNTDTLLSILRLLTLPQRAHNKVMQIIKRII